LRQPDGVGVSGRFASASSSQELSMPATPEAVAREWFEQVWNRGSEEAIDRYLAQDALMHGLSGPDAQPLRGPEGFKAFWRQFRSAFPDIRIDIERTVTEGDLIAVHCHVYAKHLGHGLPIAPTQKPVDIWGMGMARIRNGQIVEAWNAYDFMTLYQQLGMLPALRAHGASAQPA
jgi:predicted ester cyclase